MIRDGITSGCGGGNYCPSSSITRAQMAVFLLRAEPRLGATCRRPRPARSSATSHLGDFAADWIEELYAEGITGGCETNPLRYCPNNSVTRGQMAAFLLKVYHGTSYAPPPAQGVFSDVPISMPLAPWIEELARLSVTAGCGGTSYCPTNAVTRGQMAVFLTKTFHRPEAIRFLEQATWGPSDSDDRRACSARASSRGSPRSTRAARVDLPRTSLFPLWPRRHPGLLRRQLPARQLLVVSPPEPFFTERPLRPGPAAPARRVRAPQARRRLRRTRCRIRSRSFRTCASSTSTPSATTATSSTRTDAEPGDGRLPQHGHVHEGRPERELRPRDHAALLDRDGAAQPGRHDAERRQRASLPTYDQSVIDNLKLVFTGWYIDQVTVPRCRRQRRQSDD